MTPLRKRVIRKRAAGLALVAALLIFSVPGVARADTAAITKAQQDAQDLKALIDKLGEDLSKVDEDYDYANEQLSQTQAAVKKTTAQLAATQKDLKAAQQQLTNRLVDIYKQGRAGAITVLLDADNFSDLVNRFQQLTRVSRQDSQLLAQVKEYRAQVAAKQKDLTAQLAEEKAHTAETAAAKKKVEDQLALQQQLLKGKEAQVAQLQKEEAARQARLAAAARAAAEKAAAEKAAAEKAAAAAANNSAKSGGTSGGGSASGGSKGGSSTSTGESSGGSSGGGSSGGGSSGGGSDSGGPNVPSSPTCTKVVEIAMNFIGVPYLWAGSTPNGFDCSGFVKYVYAKVGVSLPHSSRMMYEYGTSVSRDQLEPGDLVFFYSPISHVGIYIGNGQMINSRTGGVRIDGIWKSYYGAKRIL
ncbi:MAG: NlpC/P60 family protein [Actinobacteria bacterium]|nr:NlpC/P60 family protein [Actinomycetota bacterium]